jgi:hypothetical protein
MDEVLRPSRSQLSRGRVQDEVTHCILPLVRYRRPGVIYRSGTTLGEQVDLCGGLLKEVGESQYLLLQILRQ